MICSFGDRDNDAPEARQEEAASPDNRASINPQDTAEAQAGAGSSRHATC
jgi:hypothetical protein